MWHKQTGTDVGRRVGADAPVTTVSGALVGSLPTGI